MQRSLLAYAAAVAFAGFAASAQADDITVETTPFVSTATRAAVLADLQQYQPAGWAPYYSAQPVLQGAKTRASATAEYIRSRGETTALTAEDSGSSWLATRAPVTAPPVVAGHPVNAH